MISLAPALAPYKGWIAFGALAALVIWSGLCFWQGRKYEAAQNSAAFVSGQLEKGEQNYEIRNSRPDDAGLFNKLSNGAL